MSSGFQQDLDQLAPGFYRVNITMTDNGNSGAFPTTDQGNKQDGGCTPNAWDSFASGSLPSTAAKALSRARGNLRFKQVVNQLSGLGDCQIIDITLTEANADAQATSLQFTVKYDRDSFIPLTGTLQGVTPVGNDANGAAMDTTAKAIRNAVAAGLYNGTTESMRVYDPVSAAGTQQAVTANASASNAALVGLVSVTQISGTTLV
jgi:hypothetical protein